MNKPESGSNFEVNKSFSLKNTLKRATASLLVAGALSGPMTGEVRAEQNPLTPPSTTTETGTMPSQETLVSEEEKSQLRTMIMDFDNVDSADLPYDTIRKLMVENDNRKYESYRQQLREAGCQNEETIITCAKWMYAVDNYAGGVMKNSKADNNYGYIKNYVTQDQIINYALTGEGLNVYSDKEGNPKFLLVHTDKKNEKAFRAAIDWYQQNGAENVIEVLSENGFCIWFPYVFHEDTGFGAATFDFSTGVVNQNADEASIKKFKDEGLRNGAIRILGTESMGIAHGRIMDALVGDNLYEFTFSGSDLEIVKSLMISYNYEFLFGKKKGKLYKDFSDSFFSLAQDFAQRFGSSINDPYVVRQLEMMTLGGLTKPLGGDNWDFAKEKIEGLRKGCLCSGTNGHTDTK